MRATSWAIGLALVGSSCGGETVRDADDAQLGGGGSGGAPGEAAVGGSGASGGSIEDASDVSIGGRTGPTDAGGVDASLTGGSGGAPSTDGGDEAPVADVGSPLPSCTSFSHGPVGACIQGFNMGKFTSFSGAITDTGPIGGGFSCFITQDAAPEAFWVEVKDDAGQPQRFGLSVPGFASPLAKGQVVQLEAYTSNLSAFSPTVAHVVLRDAAGKLIVYVGQGPVAPGFPQPSGLQLERGPEVCSSFDSCGSWGGYEMVVTVQGMPPELLGYGQTKSVGGFVITHGGDLEQKPGPPPYCFDWFVFERAVAVRPAP